MLCRVQRWLGRQVRRNVPKIYQHIKTTIFSTNVAKSPWDRRNERCWCRPFRLTQRLVEMSYACLLFCETQNSISKLPGFIDYVKMFFSMTMQLACIIQHGSFNFRPCFFCTLAHFDWVCSFAAVHQLFFHLPADVIGVARLILLTLMQLVFCCNFQIQTQEL